MVLIAKAAGRKCNRCRAAQWKLDLEHLSVTKLTFWASEMVAVRVDPMMYELECSFRCLIFVSTVGGCHESAGQSFPGNWAVLQSHTAGRHECFAIETAFMRALVPQRSSQCCARGALTARQLIGARV
jgi:hypothetical protein